MIGTTIAHYKILAKLGEGGMGEIYLAEDRELGRQVAIKVLPEELADDTERLERFKREARAVAALNHPNIVTIHEVGEVALGEDVPEPGVGQPRSFHFLVMELVEGDSLDHLIPEGGVALDKFFDITIPLADALAAAHDKGITHRDLKPANIMVTTEGQVKILDFGLAKLQQQAEDGTHSDSVTAALTREGRVVGTVPYMSPEQVSGQTVDHRTDIFSLAVILYEMATGHRPFAGSSSAHVVSAILRDQPVPVTELNTTLPHHLARVIRRCLEKEPKGRFQTARDIANELENLRQEVESGPARPAAQAARTRPRARRWWPLAVAGATVLALVAIFLLPRLRSGSPPGVAKEGRADPSPAAESRKSVAVLPFSNLSPDPDNEFFSDGITEDIITQLSKIEGLKVISRTSIMRYRQTDKSLEEIAQELDVTTILEGTVRRAGERVRISAQLIDAQSDDNLWAETYDRNLTDIFAIQSEVAQQIASNLEAELSAEERDRIEDRPTTSIAAYDKYLKGRAHYYRYLPEDNEEAIRLFRSAIDEDPEFAAAWAALGDALGQLYLFDQKLETVVEAVAASRKAIELKPELADGHKALGLAYFGRGWYQQSLQANRRAVELNPNFAPAIGNVGWTSLAIGDAETAVPWLRRSKVLDPSNPVNSLGLGLGFSMLGDQSNARTWLLDALDSGVRTAIVHSELVLDALYHDQVEEALELARRGLETVPEDPNLLCVAGVAALANNDLTEARRYLDASIEARGSVLGYLQTFSAHTVLGIVLWSTGERMKAEELFELSLRRDRRLLDEKREDWAVPFDMASIHAIRGENSEALERLKEAVTAGWRGWPVGANYPAFASLRDDPRFKELTSDLQHRNEAARRDTLDNER